jgi:hypothetical protein
MNARIRAGSFFMPNAKVLEAVVCGGDERGML